MRNTRNSDLDLSAFNLRELYICALLGYYAALNGGSVPTFRDKLSVPFSRVNKSKTLEDGTYKVPRNVGTVVPLIAARYPRREQI
jgi:hypothetical protein